ncbi:MAG: hypothetical protein ACYYK0_01560 [Candidatus Eutrophobiaceae bacterium]
MLERTNLGVMYTKGQGVPQDDKMAVQVPARPSRGLFLAQFNLGVEV